MKIPNCYDIWAQMFVLLSFRHFSVAGWAFASWDSRLEMTVDEVHQYHVMMDGEFNSNHISTIKNSANCKNGDFCDTFIFVLLAKPAASVKIKNMQISGPDLEGRPSLIFADTGARPYFCMETAHLCVGAQVPPLFFLKNVCAPYWKFLDPPLNILV